ncbi:MAG: hypothetical protein WA673_20215, partial [Candidatus Acidiferrales bacterium]
IRGWDDNDFRSIVRGGIGLAIAGALLLYLLSGGVRDGHGLTSVTPNCYGNGKPQLARGV